jgi:hypothetical protein
MTSRRHGRTGLDPGMVAGIHVFPPTLPRMRGRVGGGKKDVNGRDKPDHDAAEIGSDVSGNIHRLQRPD